MLVKIAAYLNVYKDSYLSQPRAGCWRNFHSLTRRIMNCLSGLVQMYWLILLLATGALSQHQTPEQEGHAAAPQVGHI